MCINLADGKNATTTTATIILMLYTGLDSGAVLMISRFVCSLVSLSCHSITTISSICISALLTDTPLLGKEYIYII